MENEKNILTFESRGGNINDPNYTGDIKNHRISAEFTYNNVDFYIEVLAIRTERKKHKTTGKLLNKPIRLSDNDGMMIDISARYTQVIQNCVGGWMKHDTTKGIYEKMFMDRPSHNKRMLLTIINNQLKTKFTDIEIVNNMK